MKMEPRERRQWLQDALLILLIALALLAFGAMVTMRFN
jgi:hypothetical protein